MEKFIEEYFYLNPISQIGLVTSSNKRAEKVSDMTGKKFVCLTCSVLIFNFFKVPDYFRVIGFDIFIWKIMGPKIFHIYFDTRGNLRKIAIFITLYYPGFIA